jgi:uncharacterized membrane protein
MRSKIRLLGHPVHPMLVAFPVASYVFTFASLVVFAITRETFWFRVSLVANAVGVASAALAAIPGAIDLVAVVPVRTRARRDGVVHALLNVGALALFATSLGLAARNLSQAGPMLTLALLLTGGGVLLTLAGGFYGWTMVQRHHVGLDEVGGARAPSATPAASSSPAAGSAGASPPLRGRT